MQEINKKNEKRLARELPPSSYEVITLPNLSNKPTNYKGIRDQQQGAKRQKVMPSITTQADESRSKLDNKYPCFKKTLVKSQVSGCFWMGLPRRFCRLHLPSVDTYFILEIKTGKQYKAKYLADRTAFSAGWREFSLAEKLSEGDVLVFQLINPTKFRVFRIRKGGLSEMHGDRVKLNSADKKEQSDVKGLEQNKETQGLEQDKQTQGLEQDKETHEASSPEAVSRDEGHGVILSEDNDRNVWKAVNVKKITPKSESGDRKRSLHPVVGNYNGITSFDDFLKQNEEACRLSSPEEVSPDEDHAAILSEDDEIVQKAGNVKKIVFESDSGDPKHRPYGPTVGDYNGITTFDDFVIVLEELLKKDYTLPYNIKWSYYRLCSSQKSFLHANLLKDVNPILVAGCIIETVDIANAMKSCELPTFDNNFAKWDQKLKCLDLLGMNVRFLLARLLHLQRIACNSEAAMKRQQFMNLCTEHADSEKIIKSIQEKLTELRRVSEKRADDIDKLKTEIDEHELRFREQVLAKCDSEEDYDPKSLVDYDEIKISALAKVWNRMNFEQPVCMKLVHRSQATKSGLMKIPAPFCRRYLPVVDTVMTLETENGDLYKSKYLPLQSGFSGGWGRLAVCEKLVHGDLAVFHVVGVTRIKVYIIRKGSSTIELPTRLLNLYKKAAESVLDGHELIVYDRRHKIDRNVNCRNPEEVKINFDNITGFDDFKLVIDDMLRNHDLSESTLHIYYKLCCSQNAILHENLLKGLNSEFLVEAIQRTISTTVDISIALSTCTLSTFLDNASQWSNMLKSYEALGMNVGFLISQLHQLQNLAFNSEGAVSRRRYIEACHERQRCEHELQKLKMILAMWRKISITLSSKVKALESKGGWKEYTEAYFRLGQAEDEIREIEGLIAELCKFFEHYDDVIESLKLKANVHEHEFQQKVDAPW